MQLKASSMLFIMLLIFISVLGCSQQQVIVSDKVIRVTEVIDTVVVNINVGGVVRMPIEIEDPFLVRKVISLLEGVEIKEFSASQA